MCGAARRRGRGSLTSCAKFGQPFAREIRLAREIRPVLRFSQLLVDYGNRECAEGKQSDARHI